MSEIYHDLQSSDFAQNWSNAGLITTDDNWSGVPSIVGYRGDDLTTSTGTDPRTIVTSSAVVDVNANQTNPNTFNTGGVTEFALVDPTIALAGSGTADAPYIVIHLDVTGRENLVFSANIRDLETTTDDATQQVAVQYRIGTTGNWINVPGGYIADATIVSATQATPLSVALPSAVDGQAQVQVRVMTTNAVGNDEAIGIDDIIVTSVPSGGGDPQPGAFSIADVSLLEGDGGGSTNFTFTVSRTGGSDGAVSVDYGFTLPGGAGGADAGDFSVAPAGGTLNFLDGETSKTISVQIAADAAIEPNETFTVDLGNAQGGATIADASATGTILTDDVALSYIHDVQGTAFFSPILAAEGITGSNVASSAQVTVSGVVTALDGFGTLQGFYISEEVADWDANSGTSEGIFVRSASPVSGLTVGETVTLTANVMEYQDFTNPNRTMLVNPVNIAQGNDSVALPTLVLDGTAGKAIPNQIISDDNPVFTDSVDDAGDTFDAQNDALDFYETIEGMRVTVPDMVVGDGFVGGSSDNFVYFNAYSTVHADPTLINSRGGYTITGDPQYYPVDTADAGDDVIRGGRHLSDGAVHGDMLELDFGNVGRGGASSFDQLLTMGDQLGDVTGILDFDFGVTKLYVTDTLDPAAVANLGGSPAQEITTLDEDARSLRVATFNVENLSPVGTTFSTNNGVEITTQAKYDALAANIATNLKSPDIIIVEEVQDNNGVTQDGVTDASTTWQQLVTAVNAASGKTYQWVDEAPAVSGDVGGAPGGNIRVGFLYDTARVQLGDLAADATLAERRAYTDRIGDVVRDAGDLLAVDDSMLGAEINASEWIGTRRSIVGEFTFNGQTVYAFGSHLPSKGGSGEPFQLDQNIDSGNPANGDWDLRTTLAQDVWAMQNFVSTTVDDAKLVSGGDFNEFWFNRPLEVLTGYATDDLSAAGTARVGGTKYVNLMVSELPPVERFSYDFDGRSQALDTLIADQALAAVAEFDAVHINTGYNDRTGAVNPASSDHDPSLARFDFRDFGEVLKGTAGDDNVDGENGDDSFVFSGARAGYSITNNGTTVTDIDATDGDDGTDTLANIEFLKFTDQTVATEDFQVYTLQLLHFSDGEAGLLASQTAPNLAALADAFEDDYVNSITLASGDLFLPGPFLAGGTDPSVTPILNATTGSTIPAGVSPQPAQVDIAMHNLIGVQAAALGNHEFDLGSNVLASAFAAGGGFIGAAFPYLSANLDFSGDSALASRFTQTVGVNGLEAASSLKGRIAPSTVITENGEKIGIVAATTQVLEQISSPSGTEVKGFPTGPGPNGETNDMALLAAQLQPVIDDLLAQGLNKIVLMSHLQQLQFEQELAPLLTGVDIIIGGGSNTRLGDADDVAVDFPGHSADFDDSYPIVTAGADGKTTLIVNTDSEYTYLGRLVVDFDDNGDIILDSVAANVPVSGAYAATDENVAEAWGTTVDNLETTAFADGTRGDKVRDLTEAVQTVIDVKDGNVYGYSEVYLEGERIQVRNQETNLGNVSADANADAARDALGLTADHAIVSIKNGGGIRAQIGTIEDDGVGGIIKLPPQPNGEVSQLDVENALRFNNKLMVFDTTAEGLLNILNSPNALAPNNGGFIQIGGVRFSYDPTKPAGQRVQDVVLINEHDQITAVIADNGVVNPNAPATISAVALNFTANGGDGYLVKANADNFRYLLNDGTLSSPVSEALDFTSAANVPANALGEIQAFADYFEERYGTPETAYDVADTGQALDARIQNQAVRTDTVLEGDYLTLGTAASETLNGTSGAETLKGLAGNDKLNGGDGDDVLNGGLGRDLMNGGVGSDTASYADAAGGVSVSLLNGRGSFGEAVGDRLVNIENLEGSGFNDVLTGNKMANIIHGGAGNDVIEGEGGADQLFGDAGDDSFVIEGAPKFASIDGGTGFDTILAGADNSVINWASIVGVEAISGDGHANVTIAGSATLGDMIDLSAIALTDIAAIKGNGGNDVITGSASADVINGGGGLDTLSGGAGNDTIVGGLGIDQLFGGADADKFIFLRTDSGRTTALSDTILDFASAQGDRIDLLGIDANATNGTADDAFTFIGTGAFTNVAGQLRYEAVGTDSYVSGDYNGDGRHDFMIHLTAVTSVAAADFYL